MQLSFLLLLLLLPYYSISTNDSTPDFVFALFFSTFAIFISTSSISPLHLNFLFAIYYSLRWLFGRNLFLWLCMWVRFFAYTHLVVDDSVLSLSLSTNTQVDECSAKYHINLNHNLARSRVSSYSWTAVCQLNWRCNLVHVLFPLHYLSSHTEHRHNSWNFFVYIFFVCSV